MRQFYQGPAKYFLVLGSVPRGVRLGKQVTGELVEQAGGVVDHLVFLRFPEPLALGGDHVQQLGPHLEEADVAGQRRDFPKVAGLDRVERRLHQLGLSPLDEIEGLANLPGRFT